MTAIYLANGIAHRPRRLSCRIPRRSRCFLAEYAQRRAMAAPDESAAKYGYTIFDQLAREDGPIVDIDFNEQLASLRGRFNAYSQHRWHRAIA